jgi:hypothetical protein
MKIQNRLVLATLLASLTLTVTFPHLALADVPVEGLSTVPTEGDAPANPSEPSVQDAPPAYTTIEIGGVGVNVSSNTLGGTTTGGVLDLFSFRKMRIGHDADQQCYTNGYQDNTRKCGGYPTHAVEIDLKGLAGQGDGQTWFGGSMRVRAMLAGTHLGEMERACSYYLGGSTQLDIDAYSDRVGQSKLMASIGPEGGLICQAGDTMIQFAPTAALSVARVETDHGVSNEIDTGANLLGVGGKARLLIGNKLYLSADTMWNPAWFSQWSSFNSSLSAQIKEGRWIFAGTVKHIDFVDGSGIYRDVKGNEGSVSAGLKW